MEWQNITPKNMIDSFSVLDKGFVRLDNSMADDLSVVQSARVSFGKEARDMGEPEIGLINFLMKNRHGTPFEHNAFRFHIKCPIFVAREWMRHRIGSFNEWSGRYSKLEAEFYLPKRLRTQVGKPGAYTFEEVEDDVLNRIWTDTMVGSQEHAWDSYDFLLRVGVAKEVARMILPLNIYTQFYWTLNARALMNFLSLRNSEHAMLEIREYAKAIEELFYQEMPYTYAAFVENERIAP